jgi:hypothetical protein
MAASDPATVAKGHDVTNTAKSAEEDENKQQEQAAQTIQVRVFSLFCRAMSR